MKFVADESVDGPVVRRLRNGGHDVEYIAEIEPAASDMQVLDIAQAANAVLITFDAGFGRMIFNQKLRHAGVVLLRIHQLSVPARVELVAEIVLTYADKLSGTFMVVSPGSIRVRRS